MATKTERPDKKKKKGAGKEVQPPSQSQVTRVKEFAADVKSEFGKIVWPTRKQTLGSTAVVAVLVIILSVYLGAVDLFLGKLITHVLR